MSDSTEEGGSKRHYKIHKHNLKSLEIYYLYFQDSKGQ